MFSTSYQVDLIICSTFCRFYKMIKCEEGMSIWLICLKLPASYYYEVRVCLKKNPLTSSDSTAQDVYENYTLILWTWEFSRKRSWKIQEISVILNFLYFSIVLSSCTSKYDHRNNRKFYLTEKTITNIFDHYIVCFTWFNESFIKKWHLILLILFSTNTDIYLYTSFNFSH